VDIIGHRDRYLWVRRTEIGSVPIAVELAAGDPKFRLEAACCFTVQFAQSSSITKLELYEDTGGTCGARMQVPEQANDRRESREANKIQENLAPVELCHRRAWWNSCEFLLPTHCSSCPRKRVCVAHDTKKLGAIS